MKLGSDSDYLEIIELERVPLHLPRAGDIRVSVEIRIQDFCGKYQDVWLGKEHIEKFVASLSSLESSRKGSACLSSLSLNEFKLEIRAMDALGHMEVELSLQRFFYSSGSKSFGSRSRPVKLSGGFSIDPGQVSFLKAECEALLQSL
ncbi:MAG: hypothetical protein AAGC93_08270 [Cyanobacteria bacterium P01_F01_bin.53]